MHRDASCDAIDNVYTQTCLYQDQVDHSMGDQNDGQVGPPTSFRKALQFFLLE